MKLFEITHSEKLAAGKATFQQLNSTAEIQAMADKFQRTYSDPSDTYWKIKQQVLTIISNNKSTNMHASLFSDEMKTADDLEMYIFDKVVPHIKALDWPDAGSGTMMKALQKWEDWLRKA